MTTSTPPDRKITPTSSHIELMQAHLAPSNPGESVRRARLAEKETHFSNPRSLNDA